MSGFVHIHNHSHRSLLDGQTTEDEMCRIAKEHGQEFIALTDHGTCAGYVAIEEAGRKYDIKTGKGIEAYFHPDPAKAREAKDQTRYHLILLAKNDKGLENIFKLQRIAWTSGFYGKAVTSLDALESHVEGLVATSSCMAGYIARLLENGEESLAEAALDRMVKLFKGDYYVELQPWNRPELNKFLIDIADAKGLPLIGTIDCHYPTHKHKAVEEALLCVGMFSSLKAREKKFMEEHLVESQSEPDVIKKLDILYPDRGLRFADNDHYVMSEQEARKLFADAGITRDDIFENTLEIADKCNSTIKMGQDLLPRYNKKINSDDYLRGLCESNLAEMGLDKQPEYVERLNEELEIIKGKKFSDYFLVVWDIFDFAKNNNILMGYGRGSAAGSLVCYTLGITRVADPIRFRLPFYRFISVDRQDWPDIDIDIADRDRQKIKDYIRNKYGEENVAGISTYSEFGGKMVVSDVGRIFGVTHKEKMEITPHFSTVDEFILSRDPAVSKFRKKWPHVEYIANSLNGRIRGAGAHAAGLVVSNVPLDTVVPLETRNDPNSDGRVLVTAYDMNDAQKVGLIKMDLLGLKTLSVVQDCVAKVKERKGVDVISQAETLDDPAIFEQFSLGNVVGIFQAEETASKNLLMEMGVDNFEDLYASNALVRPGALMSQTGTYIKRKLGKEPVVYDHAITEEITKESQGTWIFQEQLMEAFVKLAGMTWVESNSMRKIIGKKLSKEEFEPYREKFVSGCSEHIPVKRAEELWGNFIDFAGYAFSKNHAVPYSVLSYVTMWLKHYYPEEYVWALLVNEKNNSSIATYLLEANKLGIKMLLPDINLSGDNFELTDEGIRFGLSNISGLGPSAVTEIVANQPYVSYEDCIARCKKKFLRSNVVEALEQVGAFDSIGHVHEYESYQYYFKLLNYPMNMEVKTGLEGSLSTCREMEVEGAPFGIIKAVVKSTKRTPRYFRVELEDESGPLTVFSNSEANISSGDFLIALVGNKGIHMSFNAYEAEENREHPLFQYVSNPIQSYKGQMEQYGVGDTSESKALIRVLGRRMFTTKNGNAMGNYDIEHFGGYGKLVIFPRDFEQIDKRIQLLEPYVIKPEWYNGSLTLSPNGIITLERFMEIKEKRNDQTRTG